MQGDTNRNTLLGYLAGDSVTTGDDNIIIGYNTDAPAATTNSWLNIGDTVAGSMIAATGSNISSCGGSPSVVGNDIKGTITVGSAATGCTFTFTQAKTNDPSCVLSSQGGIVFSYTHSTTGFVITAIGTLASTLVDYHCLGT